MIQLKLLCFDKFLNSMKCVRFDEIQLNLIKDDDFSKIIRAVCNKIDLISIIFGPKIIILRKFMIFGPEQFSGK
jgi:hypothetical protein